MYDKELAGVYDLLYGVGVGKDYAAEAAEITELIRARNPEADSLLDVACGTGQHLRYFRESFADVAGVELSAEMAAVAKDRLPGVSVHIGDLRTFRLDRRFAAVTCLFSSIGYVQSVAELNQAVARLAAHLAPGGVLLVEPWFTPEQWQAGTVHKTIVEDDGRVLIRLSYSGQDGRQSWTDMHYLAGEPGKGVRHWSDQHLLTLFTLAEYEQAFAAAGLTDVQWAPGWREGRDRLIAVR